MNIKREIGIDRIADYSFHQILEHLEDRVLGQMDEDNRGVDVIRIMYIFKELLEKEWLKYICQN